MPSDHVILCDNDTQLETNEILDTEMAMICGSAWANVDVLNCYTSVDVLVKLVWWLMLGNGGIILWRPLVVWCVRVSSCIEVSGLLSVV